MSLCHRDRKTGAILHPYGKDPVGHLVPHGVLSFTDNVDTVIGWWSQGTPWNIGLRVPESMFVLDVDPRNGGLDSLAEQTKAVSWRIYLLTIPRAASIQLILKCLAHNACGDKLLDDPIPLRAGQERRWALDGCEEDGTCEEGRAREEGAR